MSVQSSSRWIIVCAFVPVKQSNLLRGPVFVAKSAHLHPCFDSNQRSINQLHLS